MAAVMNENSLTTKTILRVKRKRSDDPADLLRMVTTYYDYQL